MAERPDVILTAGIQLSSDVQSKLQQEFSRLEKNLKFNTSFTGLTRDFGNFSNELSRANQRVITLGISFGALSSASRILRQLLTDTTEVEKAFVDLNAVFKLGTQDLDRFSKGVFDVARNTSQSFDKVVEAAKEFSRQGLSATETLKRTQDAMILTRLASLDTAEAVQTLTAAVNGFQKSGLNTSQIVSKLATVDAAFAVSAKDLAQGLARAGAVAQDAGVSFDQLVGLITSAQQTTARGGAIIGNALKTIFTRIERRDTIDAFEALGVNVKDLQGNVLSAIPLLENFVKVYDTLGGSIRKQSAELVGGVYQINVLKAVLADLSKANSVYAQSQNISSNSTDEAIKRNEALNQSLSALLQQTATTTKQIFSNAGSNGFLAPLKSFLSLGLNNPVTKALEDASGNAETTGGKIAEGIMKGLGGALLYGLGPLLAKAFNTIVVNTGRNVLRDFSQAAGLTTAADENAQLQKQIVGLYQAGGIELQKQLALMSSIAEKAAAVRFLLNQGVGSSQSARSEIAGIAGVLQSQGVRSRRAAGGYIPLAEESAAVAAGVGGAPSSARPVYLPDFNLGNGQRGIVANSSEWIVPGAAGGAIFNRDMISRFGLPPGSKPVAAGGFVPNAPGGYLPSDLGFGYSRAGELRTDELNQLFSNLSQAATLAEASKFGPQIVDMAKSLSGLSEKRVLQDLAAEFNRITIASKIITDQSRRAGGPGSIIESRQWSGLPYTIPPGTVRDAMFIGPRTPGGWMPPESGGLRTTDFSRYGGSLTPLPSYAAPTLFQRLRSRFNVSPQALGLATAFTLPAIGANIAEGNGGTSSGQLRGALSTGLEFAGSGASLGGAFGGPFGALVGGVGGGIIGGLIGAIKKSERSFEELAKNISESDAALQKQLTGVQQAYSDQENVINALRSGTPSDKVDDLRRIRTQSLLALPDNLRQKVLQRINDPSGLGDISQDIVSSGRANRSLLDLTGATRGALDTSTYSKGLLSYDAGSSQRIAKALIPILQSLPREQLTALGRSNSIDSIGTFQNILKLKGADQSTVDDLTSPQRRNQNTSNLFSDAFNDALHKIVNNGILNIDEDYKQAEQATVKFQQSIHQLAEEFRHQGELTSIQASSLQNVNRVVQNLFLARPFGNEGEKIAATGLFGRSNLSDQYEAERTKQILVGRSGLIGSLGKNASTVDSIALRNQLQGLNSLDDLISLRSSVDTPGGIVQRGLQGVPTDQFKDKLDDLIRALTELKDTEDTRIDENDKITQAQLTDFSERGTRASASDDYNATYREALSNRDRSITRNDPFQTRLQAQRAVDLAKLNRDAQGGLDNDSQLGQELGLSAKGSFQQRELNARAINAILSGKGGLNSRYVTGSEVSNGLFAGAKNAGIEGNSSKSFLGGFQSVFSGIKRDIQDFSDIGQRVAQSLETSLGNAFSDFVTGAKKGKDAFREFAVSVLNDASRMLASKAVSSALSFIPGFSAPGSANGGFIGYGAGGRVPAMVMGGEYYVPPDAAQRIGPDTLRHLNGYANGGSVIYGGSGNRDDIPASLPRGSFIIRKSAVQKIGPDYLNALVNGGVQRRADGGFLGSIGGPWGAILGAVLGGGLGYAAGGKKGALGGALLGGIAGGLYSYNSASSIGPAAEAGQLGSLGIGAKLALGLGASAGLGLLSSGLSSSSGGGGALSLSQIPAYRAQLESAQAAQLGGRNGQAVYLQINPQGGYSLSGLGNEPATRRWAAGGDASDLSIAPMPMSQGPSNQSHVNVKIDINNNGTANGTTSTTNGNGAFGSDFAEKLNKQVQSVVQEELIRQSRPDGFFSQRGRYIQGAR